VGAEAWAVRVVVVSAALAVAVHDTVVLMVGPLKRLTGLVVLRMRTRGRPDQAVVFHIGFVWAVAAAVLCRKRMLVRVKVEATTTMAQAQ